MPISPPPEAHLDRPEMDLMDLFGRMRSLTESAGFSGTLPGIWQCSDESQGIKKALFGYVFDCPVFNLGRVGALLDPNRLHTAGYHGHDLVILGGSHIGAMEQEGIGYVERVHGQVVPCCGMLRRMLEEYLQLYQRAKQMVTVFRGVGGIKIEIPYKYLFSKPPGDAARLHLSLTSLADGDAIKEGTRGKIFRLHPAFAGRHEMSLADLGSEPRPLGSLLGAEYFHFSKRLDRDSLEPKTLIEVSVFDFLPEIVGSRFPHRRLCDIHTWRQFHRLASHLTDSFDSGERNILVVAGLTVDYSIRHNAFIPQYGFRMDQGRALQARYFGPDELGELLAAQPVFRSPQTFLEYAGVT